MLRDMDMTKFKEMQESDSSFPTMWLKAKKNDFRYCISNELLYERSSKVADSGLLLLPEKLRHEVLYIYIFFLFIVLFASMINSRSNISEMTIKSVIPSGQQKGWHNTNHH